MKYTIYLTLTVLFWSGNFVFGRMISNDMGAIELSFFRWFFVFLIILPYLLYRSKHIFSVFKKNYLIITALGVLSVAAFNTFLYTGLETTTATNGMLINSSIPVMIVVLSTFILNVKLTNLQIFGVILSTIGVIFLILKGNIDNIIALKFSEGDLWILLACAIWALYSVLLKHKPKELNSFDFLSISAFVGIIALAIVFFSFGHSFEFSFLKDEKVLYPFMYIVIFPSLLAFYFWSAAIEIVGANKAAQFAHLMPVFGAVLAYFVLGEILQAYHFAGAFLIGMGIYLSIFLKRSSL